MNPYVITLDTVDRCCLIIPYKEASINPIDDRQQSIHQSSLFFDNAQSTPSPQYDHPNSTLFVATATTPATPTAPAAPPYGMGPGRTGVVAAPERVVHRPRRRGGFLGLLLTAGLAVERLR